MMGCDIHFHTEIKIRGEWFHHSSSRPERNYNVFAKIGGVRNHYDILPLSHCRGIPEDATFLTKHECKVDGSDGHSHSFLNLDEIVEFHDWLGSTEGWEYAHRSIPYVFGNHLDGLKKYPADWEHTEIEDGRYIFWFDN